MDAAMITAAIADLNEQAITLARRRQLLEELLATFDPPTTPPSRTIVEGPKIQAAPPAKPWRDPVRPEPTASTVRPDINEVARIAIAARDAGRSMTAALVDHYGLPTTTVVNWLTKCRSLGLITPAPKPSAAAGTGKVTFTTDDTRELIESGAA